MHRIRLRGQREGSDLEPELLLPALGMGRLGVRGAKYEYYSPPTHFFPEGPWYLLLREGS